jgi:ubiquinone/menaquinone biosynthesis C-methylase UbiE
MAAEADRWSRWLLERRDAGLDAQRAAALAHLSAIRDRVLDAAEPLDGATLLDVGTGDGLIGLAALERVGPQGSVIFSDVSDALLARCEEGARAQSLADRARFVRARAEELEGVPDGSVDVVTTRSVLIYVAEKAEAFAAFARVLRPGGRLSLFEPINRLMYPEPDGCFWGYEVAAVADLAAQVRARFDGTPSDRRAMMGFDDRDLVDFALAAGFTNVHLECHIDVEPGSSLDPISFDALLDSAPNPNAPTTREAIAAALTESERVRFLTALRAAYDEGRSIRRTAVAYLTASRRLAGE